jgi:hypothetical protein
MVNPYTETFDALRWFTFQERGGATAQRLFPKARDAPRRKAANGEHLARPFSWFNRGNECQREKLVRIVPPLNTCFRRDTRNDGAT